ncbi:MAG: heme-binding domain-containing protein [bacterium]|nr:heme-binding domain-containing protein [bacterium]
MPPPFTIALLLAVGIATWGIYRWRSRDLDGQPAALGKLASSGLIAVVGVLVVAQLVPYGRDHTNPPVTGEPAWATPETRDLMVRACFDCHSNEVTWPWYSNIAPFSWATVDHVNEGRDAVNYSEWDRPQDEGDETLEEVKKGSMPPRYYTLLGLHSDAKLTPEEMSTLLEGLSQTPGLSE